MGDSRCDDLLMKSIFLVDSHFVSRLYLPLGSKTKPFVFLSSPQPPQHNSTSPGNTPFRAVTKYSTKWNVKWQYVLNNLPLCSRCTGKSDLTRRNLINSILRISTSDTNGCGRMWETCTVGIAIKPRGFLEDWKAERTKWHLKSCVRQGSSICLFFVLEGTQTVRFC